MDYRALLIKYMARVIDCEGVSFITGGMSYEGIEFTPDELAALGEIQQLALNFPGQGLTVSRV